MAGPPRAVLLLIGMAAAVIAVAGMKAVAGLLAPLFSPRSSPCLAHPIRRWLDRWMPSWAASAICIVVVYVGILLLALAMLVSIARCPSCCRRTPTSSRSSSTTRRPGWTRWASRSPTSKKAEVPFDLGTSAGLHRPARQLFGMVSSLFFILSLILFATFDASSFPRQLERARDEARDRRVAEGSSHQTRRYLGVSTVFGLIVAVLDTIALAMLGVPLPITWGLLAFITNHIPNIGFRGRLIPPAILALLEGGPA